MATDATGTPTTLGIPTYNTAVDPPSGKGFNAAMAVIDSLIAARAPVASPALTGTPTAPTQAGSDSSTKLATTAFVQAVIATILPSGMTVPYAGATAPGGWLIADGSAVSRNTYAALFGVIGVAFGAGDGSTTFNLPDLRGRVPVGKNAATFSALGATGGEENHTLALTEIPAHAHAGSSIASISAGTPSGTVNSSSAGTPAGSVSSSFSGNGVTVKWDNTYTKTATSRGVIDFNGFDGGTGGTDSTYVPTGAVSSSFAGSAMGLHGHTFAGNALAAHTHTLTIGSEGGGAAHNNLQPYQVLNYIIKQ